MNGLDILKSYSKSELDIKWSGFERLSVATIKLDNVPSDEDRDILRELGWHWEDQYIWKFEEWT